MKRISLLLLVAMTSLLFCKSANAQVEIKDFGSVGVTYTGVTVFFSVNITTAINAGARVYIIPAGGDISLPYWSWTMSSGAVHMESFQFAYTGSPSTSFLYQVQVVYNNGAFIRSPTQTVPLLVCTNPTLFQPQVNNGAASLTWSAPVSGGTTKFSLQYKLTSATSWTTVGPLGGAGYNTPVLPAGDYNWQVASTCMMSTAPFQQFPYAYKAGSNFQIPSTTPVGLTALMQNNINYNVVSLSWSVGAGLNPSYYELQYRIKGTAVWTTVTPVNNLNYVSPPLVSGAFYEWQVRSATNSNGKTYYSPYIKGFDFYSSACRIKSAVPVVVTQHSIQIDWTAYTDVMGMNSPVKYEIWWKNYSYGGADTISLVPSATNSYTITGLTQSSLHYVWIRVTCQSGTVSEWFPVADAPQFSWVAYPNTIYTMCYDCNPAFDAGNTRATATPISPSSSFYIKDRIESNTDVDWYSFVVPVAAKSISFTLDHMLSSSCLTSPYGYGEDYDLFLYNSAGTLISSSTGVPPANPGGQFGWMVDQVSHAVNITTPKTYYVRVAKKASSTSNIRECYRLTGYFADANSILLRGAVTGAPVILQPGAGLPPAARENEIIGNKSDISGAYNSLNVLPQPASSEITVQFNASEANGAMITIYDMSGKALIKEETLLVSGLNRKNMNVSRLNSGMYILKLQTGATIQSTKLVIAK